MLDNLTLWGLTPKSVSVDVLLPGSPERCLGRTAVEDNTGAIWMLEHLRPGQFDRREKIGRTLDALKKEGLPIPAYLPGPDGRFCVEKEGEYFQISPFVPGDPLPQPEFVTHTERGASLGEFTADLHEAGNSIHEFDNDPPFILEDYVNELMGTIAPRRPDVHEDLLPVLPVLVPLFEAWNDLPTALCQGDFHPLNIIWNDRSVAAVIDWEFMGIRPALFDVANCFGCVGIEEPRALVHGLAVTLLRTLNDRGQLDKESLSLLPELILGLRFAWMSEWLRKKDEEMVHIELRFMRLLANSIDTLLPAWDKLLEG
ncbi:phosphotransferase [Pseudodesulfovibrio sp. zrk46]|uniref:phosphotransferase n=1 Tax=Pseudodesulfovibrio sp. zrk46 TaxID=2725288 RepID=UPI001449219D|nr:phosphotransferase [Pseudodesulfovibrio sp. zrk46]QJB56480.1 phosphotransferase [Pseudodesulfovibrio sp. zrk46]